MKNSRVIASRTGTLVFMGLAVTGCTTTDYGAGVKAFSRAVSQATATQRTLASAEEKAAVAEYIDHNAGRTAVINFNKCRAVPYKAGDCVVEVQGQRPPTVEPSSMGELTRYAALLSAVVTDKTCVSLQSDAADLASAVSGMAKNAHMSGLQGAVSPLANIVSAAGCIRITHEQLAILRAATERANPIIKKLIPIVAQNDDDMYSTAVDYAVSRLDDAATAYNKTKTAKELEHVVRLSVSVDRAQSQNPVQIIQQLAAIHQALTDDLRTPKVNWKRVEADGRAFVANAKTLGSSVEALAKAAKRTR